MPHATRTVGRTEIAVCCDGVVTAGGTPAEAFPTVPAEVWDISLPRFPDTRSSDGQWQLHIHCHLVRTQDAVVLIDTGVGPASAPAFDWTGAEGRLLADLEAAGVDPREVDAVAISHVHDDHLGWTLTPEATPVFPNARYVLQRADWDFIHAGLEPEDADIAARTLDPLLDAGVLDLLDGNTRLTPTLRLRHEPGHTPGHQIAVVEDGGDTALLSADVTNHPAQLGDPTRYGTTDADPELANATRARVLAEAADAGWVVSTAHYADAFGRFVRRGEAYDWETV